MTDRAREYINLLMDLGDYNEHNAAQIYLKELKHCKNNREREQKCFLILEKRRHDIGLSEF